MKFHEIWTQRRRWVRRWKLSEQKKFTVYGNFFLFRKLYPKGSFFQKTQISQKCQRLATAGHHKSAMITDGRKFTNNWSLYGMSRFHFYRQNQFKANSPGLHAPYKKRNRQLFRYVTCGWHTATMYGNYSISIHSYSPEGAMSYILYITWRAIISFAITENNCAKINFVYWQFVTLKDFRHLVL